MMLVSRSGRNPDVYIPPIRPPEPGTYGYFLALDIIRAGKPRRAHEEPWGEGR